ncbi:MAG: hypothetical protein Tsb0019_02680 [Roseibium sp.]
MRPHTQSQLTKNITTDWTYAGGVYNNGCVLTLIGHDRERFLKKAQLLKCYARIKNSSSSKFVAFDIGKGMNVGAFNLKLQGLKARSPDYYYKLSHKAYATFKFDNLAGSGQSFAGEQYFGFTETSSTPRHETVGVAAAGRFYPSLDFSVPPVKKASDHAVEALRFDYWFEPDVAAGGRRVPNMLHPAVEFSLGTALSILQQLRTDLDQSVPQQAALFRDRDYSLLHRAYTIGGLGKPGEQIFINAEKPLKWEVVGPGITKGGKAGWDNIHIWGYNKLGLVSTPGMPFGIHLHWRWSAAVTNPAAMALGNWTPDFLRAPELAGRSLSGKMIPGGPLIDPRTPKTDLTIAVVTRSVAEAYAKKTAASEGQFLDLFKSVAATPADIRNGTDMVILVSIVMFRPDRKTLWRSTVFPHGFFFPHAYELSYAVEASLTMAGAYSEQYLSKPPKRGWYRKPV